MVDGLGCIRLSLTLTPIMAKKRAAEPVLWLGSKTDCTDVMPHVHEGRVLSMATVLLKSPSNNSPL
jgi:hypothetical protein